MLLVHRFDGFFRFLICVFKVFLLNRFKNLKAQLELYQKRAGVGTLWNPHPPHLLLDVRLKRHYWEATTIKYLTAATPDRGESISISSLVVNGRIIPWSSNFGKSLYLQLKVGYDHQIWIAGISFREDTILHFPDFDDPITAWWFGFDKPAYLRFWMRYSHQI